MQNLNRIKHPIRIREIKSLVVLRKNIIRFSRGSLFQPIFVVQPADDILDSDRQPAGDSWLLTRVSASASHRVLECLPTLEYP
jgi:hypothetical protein